jgi:hypothetical protein
VTAFISLWKPARASALNQFIIQAIVRPEGKASNGKEQALPPWGNDKCKVKNLGWFWSQKYENPGGMAEHWSDGVMGMVVQKSTLIWFDLV